MKKIFTLFAAVMMALLSNAANTVDLTPAWSWGWNSEVTTEDGNYVIKINGAWGAGAEGGLSADWSMYSSITFVVESYTGTYGQFIISDGHKDDNGELKPKEIVKTCGAITSQTEISIDLTATEGFDRSNVTKFAVQGNAADVVFTISRIYLTEAVDYEEPKAVTMSDNGVILASEFNGLSDDALVEFIFTTTNPEGFVGWGAGDLKSLDGSVKVAGMPFNVKGEGDASERIVFSALKEALNAGPNDNGKYGIAWNLWGFGENCKNARKAVNVYQVKGFTGEGYVAPYMEPEPEPEPDPDPAEPTTDNLALRVKLDVAKDNNWDSQVLIPLPEALEAGKNYEILFAIKGSVDSEENALGSVVEDTKSENRDQYGNSADLQYTASFSATTDWKQVSLVTNGEFPYDRLILNIGKYKGYLYIDDLKVYEVTEEEPCMTIDFNSTSMEGEKRGYHDHVTLKKVDSTNTVELEPTGIKNINKVANSVMFNIAGQRVNNAQGVVILNGKKFVK